MEDKERRTTVPSTGGRLKCSKTGQFTGYKPTTGTKWKNRHGANLSPFAYLKMLKVQLLLREMMVDFEVSMSSAVEFMYAIMEAYHDRERLDVRAWRPETRYIRVKKNWTKREKIKDIADAMDGGEEYLRNKIEQIERDYETVRGRNSHRARASRQRRAKDQSAPEG